MDEYADQNQLQRLLLVPNLVQVSFEQNCIGLCFSLFYFAAEPQRRVLSDFVAYKIAVAARPQQENAYMYMFWYEHIVFFANLCDILI